MHSAPEIFDPVRAELNELRKRVRDLTATNPYARGRADAFDEIIEEVEKERSQQVRYAAAGQVEPPHVSLAVLLNRLRAKRREASDG